MRIDLRFAKETPSDDSDSLLCLQRGDPLAITRFFESLKSQLIEEHHRQRRKGAPWLFSYFWCREQDTGAYPHYHLTLVFNKDHYAHLSADCDLEAINLTNRIRRAWCSALNLHYPDYARLVHFPNNRVYWVTRDAAINREPVFSDMLYRIAYLSKLETKDINDGRRNFGCSQPKYQK